MSDCIAQCPFHVMLNLFQHLPKSRLSFRPVIEQVQEETPNQVQGDDWGVGEDGLLNKKNEQFIN